MFVIYTHKLKFYIVKMIEYVPVKTQMVAGIWGSNNINRVLAAHGTK